MHSTTSQKVAGSILNKVVGFFSKPDPTSRFVDLGSSQPLTEISTRNLPMASGQQERKADSIIAIYAPTVYVNIGASHKPMGLHGLLQG
jgi:hypothetical protein